MISKQAFIYKIKTEVFPDLIQTEKGRKIALFIGSCWIASGLLFAYFFRGMILEVGSRNSGDRAKGYFTIVFFLCSIGALVWNRYVKKQKKKFSPIFLRFLGDLKNSQNIIDRLLLRYSCLFSEFDSVCNDDCISGVFNDTEFSIIETKLTIGSGKNRHTVFSGVCIDIPMKASVSGYTLLFNTKIPQRFPVLEKITLEDVSFGKNYQIYSNNQIDARVLLTPAFMERLNELKKCFQNNRVDVSFFGNHALFVIHTHKNLFESYSIFRPVTRIKTYTKFYDEIKVIHDMMEILHLNNKSLPAEAFFNRALYEQISSKKQMGSLYLPLLGKIFMGVVIIMVIMALVIILAS